MQRNRAWWRSCRGWSTDAPAMTVAKEFFLRGIILMAANAKINVTSSSALQMTVGISKAYISRWFYETYKCLNLDMQLSVNRNLTPVQMPLACAQAS